MCRLAAYLGPEIFISSLVTEPKHSIIHQSYHAREIVEPLNGDGFGIGWYAPQFCEAPALFKEVSPAWNNVNLKHIARVTRSTCVFAHVRAASTGGLLSQTNCHPFAWRNYLFMHNGTVYGFDQIERALRQGLSDEAYNLIGGYTDSEHIFALFADQVKDYDNPTVEELGSSLREAIKKIETLKGQAGVTEPSTMNLVLTDGRKMIATRYVSEGNNSNSLYIRPKDDGKSFLVVSEPLKTSQHWERVKNNQMILVDLEKEVCVQSL